MPDCIYYILWLYIDRYGHYVVKKADVEFQFIKCQGFIRSMKTKLRTWDRNPVNFECVYVWVFNVDRLQQW